MKGKMKGKMERCYGSDAEERNVKTKYIGTIWWDWKEKCTGFSYKSNNEVKLSIKLILSIQAIIINLNSALN